MNEPTNGSTIPQDRHARMLRTALGPYIAAALVDPEVVEILLNPDGALWIDRLRQGRQRLDQTLTVRDAERIIRLVAAHVQVEVHAGSPIVSAELPETGERFEGVLPPLVRAPAFAIRKRAIGVIPLHQYVDEGVLSADQCRHLRAAVQTRQNILIAGGAGSGKTTLANALLQEIAHTGDRVLLMEDTVELQCVCEDHVPMRTKPGVATLTQLVRSALRMRPDRLVIGEVRGGEALDLLKAWGTGHPGGVATVHAGSARAALTRVEQLIQEVLVTVPRALIAEAVDVVAFIERHGASRRVAEIMTVTGLNADGYVFETFSPTEGEQ